MSKHVVLKIGEDSVMCRTDWDPGDDTCETIVLVSPMKLIPTSYGCMFLPWVLGTSLRSSFMVNTYEVRTHGEPSDGMIEYYEAFIDKIEATIAESMQAQVDSLKESGMKPS